MQGFHNPNRTPASPTRHVLAVALRWEEHRMCRHGYLSRASSSGDMPRLALPLELLLGDGMHAPAGLILHPHTKRRALALDIPGACGARVVLEALNVPMAVFRKGEDVHEMCAGRGSTPELARGVHI